MAIGNASSPVRFGFGQSAVDARNLYLKVFGGEVLSAFDLATLTLDKHEVKSIGSGKSWAFPKVWKATSEYHTPGSELLGTDIDTTEIVITVDDILVSHTAIADLDKMLSHFDVRSKFADAMGYELAKVFDKNVFRQLILAARTSSDGPFPAGTVITDSALTDTGVANGADWIAHIREARRALYNLDVPEHLPLYFAANGNVFDAIKWATDANGRYLVLDRDFAPSGGGTIQGHEERLVIDGVQIFKSRNMPTADETSTTSVYSKYRSNYSTMTGVMWTPMAMATVRRMDINFETERDTRRLEDFMVASMLVGHGTLRPECAVEFKTS